MGSATSLTAVALGEASTSSLILFSTGITTGFGTGCSMASALSTALVNVEEATSSLGFM